MGILSLGFLALACPIGMGAMMWLMMRGQKGDFNVPNTERELAQLRRDIDQLEAERSTESPDRG